MNYSIPPITSTNNQKGRTHNRQGHEEDGFAKLLAQGVHGTSKVSSESARHHNSDVVQLHSGLDFDLQNLAGQVMHMNFELHRTLSVLSKQENDDG